MPRPGEEVEAETGLNTTCSPSALSSIAASNESLYESANLPLLVKSVKFVEHYN